MWRRLIYLGAILLWLVVACFPLAAFVLATRSEVKIGSGDRNGIRIFLLQEENAGGLGIEWTRQYRLEPDCSKTTVRYLLWEGGEEDINVDYCLCDGLANDDLQILGTCQ